MTSEGDRTSTGRAMTWFGLVVVGIFLLILCSCGASPTTRAAPTLPSTSTSTTLPVLPPSTMVPKPEIEIFNEPVTAALEAVRLDPPTTVTIPEPTNATEALYAAGATDSEVAFLVLICQRESGCRLDAHYYSTKHHDDSWGPWQINFWGDQRGRLYAHGITEDQVVASWRSAAEMVLILLRWVGRCAWIPPGYCS